VRRIWPSWCGLSNVRFIAGRLYGLPVWQVNVFYAYAGYLQISCVAGKGQ
jgi:hypothetical protein